MLPYLRCVGPIVLNPIQVSRLYGQTLRPDFPTSPYSVSLIGGMKRSRDSVDGERRVEERVPKDRLLPSSEPIQKDVYPAKRRKTVGGQASTSRVKDKSPSPVQSRVLPRRPARKGKITEPTAVQAAGERNESTGKDTEKGRIFTHDANVGKGTVQTNKRDSGKGKAVSREVVLVDDRQGGLNNEWIPGKNKIEAVDNDADHDGDVESETEAGKKPPPTKTSRKGEQVNMITGFTLKSRQGNAKQVDMTLPDLIRESFEDPAFRRNWKLVTYDKWAKGRISFVTPAVIGFNILSHAVLPIVWFYLHPFVEQFLVEQLAVGHLLLTFARNLIGLFQPAACDGCVRNGSPCVVSLKSFMGCYSCKSRSVYCSLAAGINGKGFDNKALAWWITLLHHICSVLELGTAEGPVSILPNYAEVDLDANSMPNWASRAFNKIRKSMSKEEVAKRWNELCTSIIPHWNFYTMPHSILASLCDRRPTRPFWPCPGPDEEDVIQRGIIILARGRDGTLPRVWASGAKVDGYNFSPREDARETKAKAKDTKHKRKDNKVASDSQMGPLNNPDPSQPSTAAPSEPGQGKHRAVY